MTNNTKKKLMKYLKQNKIGCQVHYKPLYKHKIYKNSILINKSSIIDTDNLSTTQSLNILTKELKDRKILRLKSSRFEDIK